MLPTTIAATAIEPPATSASSAALSAFSLAMKPTSGGNPAIDAAPITEITITGRHAGANPCSRRMSRVWAWWSTTPTVMNSPALNAPWARRTAQPASVASSRPTPSSTTMNPSWLTVP
jgi:hypothetical protein